MIRHEWLGQVFKDSRLFTQLRLLEWLKFVLSSQESVFRLVCVIKCLMILMESYYYYLLSISFGYVFCLHMLYIKVYKKTSVGGDTQQQQDGSRSPKSWKPESNGTRTTLATVGLKQAREWATQPPTWAGQPSPALPHLALRPRLGSIPIHSIFICFAFRFDPNLKSYDN